MAVTWVYDGAEWILAAKIGAGSFVNLLDCPDTMAGQGGKTVKVNPGETALEFVEDDQYILMNQIFSH